VDHSKICIDLSGRRALVTGGNSGIGAAIVASLAAAGADVAINYVSHPEAAEAGAGAARNLGARALALEADVSDAGAVAGMFAAIDAAWGGLDILVNNAGIDGAGAMGADADPAAWRRVIEINLFGAFYCAQQALQRMLPQKRGVILNISSVHEVIPWSTHSSYAASKAGLSMLTRTLSQEAAPAGVRVLALAPGAIRTPINRTCGAMQRACATWNQKYPSDGWARPARSGRWWRCWSRTLPATSPARPSSSTAA
jgi:NAD(P)-dependent dehydrogenase (short-subunit alcohol dehydrogenase family)